VHIQSGSVINTSAHAINLRHFSEQIRWRGVYAKTQLRPSALCGRDHRYRDALSSAVPVVDQSRRRRECRSGAGRGSCMVVPRPRWRTAICTSHGLTPAVSMMVTDRAHQGWRWRDQECLVARAVEHGVAVFLTQVLDVVDIHRRRGRVIRAWNCRCPRLSVSDPAGTDGWRTSSAGEHCRIRSITYTRREPTHRDNVEDCNSAPPAASACPSPALPGARLRKTLRSKPV
jgi:hypothetical protein